MLKVVFVLLSLALLSEAAEILNLFKIEDIKSKAEEIDVLKSKYSKLIGKEYAGATKVKFLNYEVSLYYGLFSIETPGQEFHVLFNTGSFYNLYSKGVFNANFFSFALHRHAIVLNTTDSNYYVGEIDYIPFSSESYWQIPISASVAGLEVCDHCQAIINPGTSLITVPDSQYETILNAIGATFSTIYNDYVVDCSIVNNLPNLHFTIGERKFSIEPKEYIIRTRNHCATVFEKLGADLWIFGDIFMKKHYLAFDLANKRVGFAVPK